MRLNVFSSLWPHLFLLLLLLSRQRPKPDEDPIKAFSSSLFSSCPSINIPSSAFFACAKPKNIFRSSLCFVSKVRNERKGQQRRLSFDKVNLAFFSLVASRGNVTEKAEKKKCHFNRKVCEITPRNLLCIFSIFKLQKQKISQ